MKTTNKIFYSVILAKLLAIGLVFFAATSQSKTNAQRNLEDHVATTTAANLKLAGGKQIQTVINSSKRPHLEDKFTMNFNQTRTFQEHLQFTKKIHKIA